jgi:hypothetical protein
LALAEGLGLIRVISRRSTRKFGGYVYSGRRLVLTILFLWILIAELIMAVN